MFTPKSKKNPETQLCVQEEGSETCPNQATGEITDQDPTVSYRMSDPEGDQGWYTGPGDKEGNAHGLGQMKYDDGSHVFIGEFFHGNMTRGALWKDSKAVDSIDGGKWTDEFDSAIAEQFPHLQDSPGTETEKNDGKGSKM